MDEETSLQGDVDSLDFDEEALPTPVPASAASEGEAPPSESSRKKRKKDRLETEKAQAASWARLQDELETMFAGVCEIHTLANDQPSLPEQ